MILPTGPAGDALMRLAMMISVSATFQSETKSEDATAALELVNYPHLRDDFAFNKPIAVVKLADGGLEHYRAAGGAKTEFLLRGSMSLILGRPMDPKADSREEELAFLNYCESILSELNEASGVSDNLNIVGLSMTSAPARTDPRKVAGNNADPPYYMAEFKIDWDQI